ncbi:hypothetical protein CEXT_629911 [Caerostris extrusa]|uniref:Uncharacterized protein n=1 Tax=Caerostris extrusa TaxID=172846 RepID=A0AAV4MSH8_CAEEX|nr:hypothetical protein CEXT_629911 [Caerostris extrusa]
MPGSMSPKTFYFFIRQKIWRAGRTWAEAEARAGNVSVLSLCCVKVIMFKTLYSKMIYRDSKTSACRGDAWLYQAAISMVMAHISINDAKITTNPKMNQSAELIYYCFQCPA